METKQKLDEDTKNKSAEDYSNKVLNVSSSMNWGVHMYHGNKIQMDTSKAMGEQIVLLYRHSSIYAVNVGTQKRNRGSKTCVNRGYLVVLK